MACGHARGIADWVAAGQADADLDAVGDRGARVVGEHDGLVAASGEIAERVVLAISLQQAADCRLVFAGERVLGTLRLEQHDGRGHQRDSSEQPEQVLSTTCGWPVKKSASASTKPLTRFSA